MKRDYPPKEFSCMDDSPLNTGFGYDERRLDYRFPDPPDVDEEDEEEIDYPEDFGDQFD